MNNVVQKSDWKCSRVWTEYPVLISIMKPVVDLSLCDSNNSQCDWDVTGSDVIYVGT
jgi:hypothetical protein